MKLMLAFDVATLCDKNFDEEILAPFWDGNRI